MKLAITGGSGVVGSSILSHAVAAGHEVVALARSPGSRDKVESLGARPVAGDVLDPSSLESLVAGAAWVFNAAGVNEMCSVDPSRMDRVNLVGTWNVLEACRRAGVGRVIHTSSAVAIGEERGVVGDEGTRHRGSYLSRYERAKHLSERMVVEFGDGLDVVLVNPSSVQGPGRATGTGKLILDIARGKVPFLVRTTVSIVDIDDCGRGHLLAAEHGVSGQRYLLNGASLDLGDAIGIIRRVTGLDIEERYLPGQAVSMLAGAVEWGSQLLGRQAPVCREMVRVLRHGHRYDGSRATRELGLEYHPLEDTVRRTFDWFRSEGLLAAPR